MNSMFHISPDKILGKFGLKQVPEREDIKAAVAEMTAQVANTWSYTVARKII